jgi:hypothetical protein
VGIAATTLFSVVNGVLLRPLSFPESYRLVRLCRSFAALARVSDVVASSV